MVRRFILGGLFGCLLGLGLGVAVAYALRVATLPLLGALFAAGVGATVAVIVRRPVFRQVSALETVLRSALGMLLGGGVHLALRRFADVALPMTTPPLGAGVHLPEHPVLVGSIVGLVVGLLLGIEPAPSASVAKSPKAEPKAPSTPSNSGAGGEV